MELLNVITFLVEVLFLRILDTKSKKEKDLEVYDFIISFS